MNYTEIEMEWMKEILRDKEEEIKKLKSDLSLVIKERDDNIEQNKKLKEENSYRKKIVDITPQDEKSVAEETIQDLLKENQKLNKRIKELELCNLNLQTWIDNKEKVNISLREENKRLSDFLECEA